MAFRVSRSRSRRSVSKRFAFSHFAVMFVSPFLTPALVAMLASAHQIRAPIPAKIASASAAYTMIEPRCLTVVVTAAPGRR